MNKKNDMMLNVVANPNFSIADFNAVGLTAENTSLQSRDYYKNNPFIRDKYTKEDGRFDDKAFNADYQSAQLALAVMSDEKQNDLAKRQFKYAASNIFAKPEERDYDNLYKPIVMPNPTKQSFGVTGWQEQSKKLLSDDELAQKSHVLLNPLTAGDNLENAEWGDNPHSGFFDYWNKTLVMAQWDSDGTHIDPVTGVETKHQAGEYKIGKDGSYYYELLDGRNIYGKKVLNKMNVLSEEGSFANKYLDFLDSDDIHKNLGSTLLKNAALVGTMFIPGIGPYATAISLIPSLTGIMGTLGKFATGSNNSFFSELEGFAKSWEQQGNVSEENNQSVWHLEGLINLIGDTISQLRQQRFIFQYAPALFKGKLGGTEKHTDKLFKEFEKDASEFYAKKLSALKNEIKAGKTENLLNYASLYKAQKQMSQATAMSRLNTFTKEYNKIGEVLSKGYMTAITVNDTYAEAKEAGASDLEAMLLTLAYGASEAWLLNTQIGEWILPELQNHRAQNRMAVRKLMESMKKAESEQPASVKAVVDALRGDKSNKREWASKVINTAKDFFKGEYFANGMKASENIVGATLAGGLGEAVEETAEEFLADVWHGVYNLGKWLSDDDSRMSSFGFNWKNGEREWDPSEMIDRYGMSFLGGLLGGSITNIGTAYNINKNISNWDSMQAYQHIVNAARNGELDAIRKETNKYVDANDVLAAVPTRDSDGNINYIAKDGELTQQGAVKQMLHQIYNFVENTLEANEINLTDDEFIDKQTLNEWRFQLLRNSGTSIDFLNDFNRLSTQLVKKTAELEELQKELLDTNRNGVIEDGEERHPRTDQQIQEEINNTKQDVDDLKKKLKDYTDGKYAVDFVNRALFEMSPYLNQEYGILSFPAYIEAKLNKSVNDLTQEELKTEFKLFENEYLKNPTSRDNIKYAAQFKLKLDKLLAPVLNDIVSDVDTEAYIKARNAFSQLLNGNAYQSFANDEDQFVKYASRQMDKVVRLASILRAIDPDTYDNIYKPHQEQIRRIDIQNRWDKSRAIAKYNKSLKDETAAYESTKQQHENDYQKALQDIAQEIEDLKQEIDKLTQERNNLSGIEKGKRTRQINSKTVKLQQLENERQSKEDNLKVQYDQNIEQLDKKFEETESNLKGQLNKDIADSNINAKEKVTNLNNNTSSIINQNLYTNLSNYLQAIIDKGYIEESLRKEIEGVLNQLEFVGYLDDIYGNPLFSDDQVQSFNNLKNKILNLPKSKIDSILNKFSLVAKQQPFNYSDLISKIHKQLQQSSTINDVKTLEEIDNGINAALQLIHLVKGSIKSAMTDNISVAKGIPIGVNAHLNYISEKQGNPLNLALILESEAQPLLYTLQNMENQLRYMQAIYDINKGNKFSQHQRANVALVQTRFTALKKFIDKGDTNPWKQYKGYNELEVALRSVLDTPLDQLSAEEFEQNKVKVYDAIYEFGQLNQDKLLDSTEFSLFLDQFDLTNNSNSQNVTEKMNYINDQDFVQFLLSCLSIKSSDFYYQVANSDFGNIAPIPLQIESARMVIANIMNKNLYVSYIEATEKSIKRKLENMSPSEFANLLAKNLNGTPSNPIIQKISNNKEQWFGALILPQFDMIHLVDGIAGSGKTQGVFRIVDVLTSKIPTIKKKFFVHGAKTKEGATEVANEIFGVGNSEAYSLKDFMNFVVNDYKELQYINGKYEVPNGVTSIRPDGKVITTQTLKQHSNYPSIIFIDEITLFSEFDIQAINQFAKEHNIHIITAGDFNQNAVEARLDYQFKDGTSTIYTVSSHRQHFISSPKLGISMRTGNSVKTNNQQKLETYLNLGQLNEELRLEYVIENNQLLGDCKVGSVDEALEKIRLMCSTLETNETITYIYDNPNSLLKKELEKPEFNGKIVFKADSQAQGDETRYAIVDIVNPSNSLESKWRSLNTGITRSSQGSVVLTSLNLTSVQLDSAFSEAGYKEHLENYTKAQLNLLKSIYQSGEELKYVALQTQQTNPQQNTPTQTNPSQTNPQPPQNNPPQIRHRQRFKNGTRVDILSRNITNATVIGFDPTKNKYEIQYTDVVSRRTITETFEAKEITISPLNPQQINDELNKVLQIANNLGLTLTIDSLRQVNQKELTDTHDILIDSIKRAGFQQNPLENDYPYIGIDSVEDLIKLLNGDTSLFKIETNTATPHLIYLFGDGNINSIDDISRIYTTSNLVPVLEQYLPTLEVNNVDDLGGYISVLELDKYNLFSGDEGFYENYDEHIDEINDELETKIEPQTTVSNTRKNYLTQMDFEITFHSMNCLELGAIEDGANSFMYDQHGTYTDANGVQHPRIDSVNGLKRLNDLGLLGSTYVRNAINNRNKSECLNVLAYLQNILYVCDKDVEICELVANELGLKKEDLFITYGLKKIPTRSSVQQALGQNLSGKQADSSYDTQYHKDINEKVYGLDTTTDGSSEVSSTQIVARIGVQGYGDMLEIPMFSISNPITILNYKDSNGNFIYPLIVQALNNAKQNNKSSIDVLLNVVKNPQNYGITDSDTIYHYIRLYLSNNYFFFRFGKLKDSSGHYTVEQSGQNIISKMKKQANFQNRGLQFSQRKGLYQYDEDILNFDVQEKSIFESNDLDEFVKNPRFQYSSVMQVKNGILETPEGKKVTVQAGHNFILAYQGIEPNLSDEEMLKKYIDGDKDIQLIYVVPPKATIKDFATYLNKVLSPGNNNTTYKIGFPDTVFKIMEIILSSKTLSREAIGRQKQIIFGVNEQAYIDKINLIRQAYKEYLNDRNKLSNYKILFSENFINEKSFTNFLNNMFLQMIKKRDTGELDYDFIQKIQNEIDSSNESKKKNGQKQFHIYYTTKQKGGNLYGAKRIQGFDSNTYKLEIDGEQRSFKIKGELNTFTFTGQIPYFDVIVKPESDNVRLNSEPHTRRTTQGEPVNDDSINKMQTILDSVLEGTGKQVQVTQGTEEELDRIIKTLNSDPNNLFVIYRVGNEVKRSFITKFVQDRTVKFIDSTGQEITKIPISGTFNMLLTDNNGNTKVYEAFYENGKIKYNESYDFEGEIGEPTANQVLNDMINNINDNQEFVDWYNSIHNSNGTLSDEYYDLGCYDGKLDLDMIEPEGLDSAESRLQILKNMPQSNIIDELINFERSLISKLENENNDSCKLTFTL